MFIMLKSGEMINLFWLQDCKLDIHDNKVVIYYMINGSMIKEVYETELEANKQLQAVLAQLKNASYGSKPIVVSELPTENISESATYLVPDKEATEQDMYKEYRYVNGKWELQGVTTSQLQLVKNELLDFKNETNTNFTNTNKTINDNKSAQDKINDAQTKLNNSQAETNKTLDKKIDTNISKLNKDITTKLTWVEY